MLVVHAGHHCRCPHCLQDILRICRRCLFRTFTQLVVLELLERFPPEATGIAGSAHMRAAAAYLGGCEDLALCRRTVGSAIPSFDPDAATSPVGVFCTVCSSPIALHMQNTGNTKQTVLAAGCVPVLAPDGTMDRAAKDRRV